MLCLGYIFIVCREKKCFFVSFRPWLAMCNAAFDCLPCLHNAIVVEWPIYYNPMNMTFFLESKSKTKMKSEIFHLQIQFWKTSGVTRKFKTTFASNNYVGVQYSRIVWWFSHNFSPKKNNNNHFSSQIENDSPFSSINLISSHTHIHLHGNRFTIFCCTIYII